MEKKNFKDFLLGEEGSISKKSIIKVGSVIAAGVAAAAASSTLVSAYPTIHCQPPCGGTCHSNSVSVEYRDGKSIGTHSHGHAYLHCDC
jgi:hypothetical protein